MPLSQQRINIAQHEFEKKKPEKIQLLKPYINLFPGDTNNGIHLFILQNYLSLHKFLLVYPSIQIRLHQACLLPVSGCSLL